MLRILVNYHSGDKKFDSKHVLVDQNEYEKNEAIAVMNAILKQIPDADIIYEYFIDEED